jgi:hypothetical protein
VFHVQSEIYDCGAARGIAGGLCDHGRAGHARRLRQERRFLRLPHFRLPEGDGTDRGGYSTLVTSYFKSSVTTMLEARGYKYSAENPDLLVNFYMNTRDRSETRPNMGGGYYGYRNGLYGGWPMYQETVNYQVGTINLDLVDAAKKQLIWEGVSEGRVTEESLANPKVTVNAIVTELLRKYPGKPNM